MELFIFFVFEIFFFLSIKNHTAILLFHHFPEKIKFKVIPKNTPPFIKNSELNEIIKKYDFHYVGIRKEYIFKFFSLSYFLFKNDLNHYLDITKNLKFYYISYFLNKKLYLYYKKNIQITPFENDELKISFIDENFNFEQAEKIEREKLADFYYKTQKSLLPLKIRIPLYLFTIIYIVQFFYIMTKWVI